MWVYDDALTDVLLVAHRRRGWVMPGGKVEVGEPFRDAAVRELMEETGLLADPDDLTPAASHAGWDDPLQEHHWGISYALVVPRDVLLHAGEDGQPVAWWPLTSEWPSVYPHDRQRLVDHAAHVRASA